MTFPRTLWLPLLLMAAALLILCIDPCWEVNLLIKEWVIRGCVPHCRIDDYMQYLPLVAYLCIPGRQVWWKKVLLATCCIALMQGCSEGLKALTGVWRPDESTPNSFPSGHTGTAFVNATLLALEWKEHRAVGVAGYSVAVATGFMRILNNRHWLSDVLFGAGLGMLTVFLVYHLLERRL